MKKQLIDLNLLSIFKKNCDSEYQDKLMFDTFPVLDSLNPITSGGVYAALAGMSDIKDLSLYDVAGVRTLNRNTANCYVARAIGVYRIPLVYGNGIKNGMTNNAAYTKITSSYGADFVNHLGNLITNPYIEFNVGCTPNQVGLLWQTSVGMINNISLYEGDDCSYIQFTVASIPTTNGVAVLYVTDSNNDIMWSWMIWLTTDDLTDITITNHTNVDYDLLGLPLGAIWNAGHTRYSVPHFQWGRKDPMCPPSAYNSTSNMTLYDISGNVYEGFGNYGVANDRDAGGTIRSVANSIKLPNKFFLQYDDTNYNWNNLSWFNNFWNAAETLSSSLEDNQNTAVKTIYDPCPYGYKLPSGRFATGFSTDGNNHYAGSDSTQYQYFNVIDVNGSGTIDASDFVNGWTMKKNSSDTVGLYFPAAGGRDRESGGLGNVGSNGNWWTFAPYSQTIARSLGFGSAYMGPLSYYYRAYGFGVWPARE